MARTARSRTFEREFALFLRDEPHTGLATTRRRNCNVDPGRWNAEAMIRILAGENELHELTLGQPDSRWIEGEAFSHDRYYLIGILLRLIRCSGYESGKGE
jgi:hypothetical protein